MSNIKDKSAGKFSSWLEDTQTAQLKGTGVEVPCGDCNACCRSSYFINIQPNETLTLQRIPTELHFPAPGLPEGHVVLGYDEKGHCPMLINDKCSIYEDRPQTCRSYDCRIFPASGVSISEDDNILISQQIKRWKFEQLNESEQAQHLAVKAAVSFLKKRQDILPSGFVPSNPTQLAVLAIKVYAVFLKYSLQPGSAGEDHEDRIIAKAIMNANEQYEVEG